MTELEIGGRPAPGAEVERPGPIRAYRDEFEHAPRGPKQSRAARIWLRRIRRLALIGVIIVFVSMLGLTGLLLWWSPGTTEPFLDANGNRVPGSISEKLSVQINGVQQGMVIRGKSASNPVLLWVHGGPGMPDLLPHPAVSASGGGLVHRRLVGSARGRTLLSLRHSA